MNHKEFWWFAAFMALFFVISIYFYHQAYKMRSEGFISSDTVFREKIDTVYKMDTLRITEFKPRYVEKLKVDTVYDSSGNGFELVTERKKYQDTLFCSNDTAMVTVWTSGVNAKVDSLSLLLNRKEIIKEHTITITNTVEKRKLFYISPQVGVGYGVFNKKVDFYVGVGVGMNLRI
jgi:hypothetical protein